MTTIVQFWQQERDVYDAAQTAAQNDLTAAQLSLVAAKAALDADSAKLDKLNADIAANRAKLATTSVPSEVTALTATITQQIITQRGLQGTLLDDQEAIAWAQADADAATAAMTRATSDLAAAEAKLAAAKDANKQRQLMKTQVTLPPLDTLKSDATTFLGGSELADAKTQIDANIPAALQTIASKRFATRTGRAAQLKQSVLDAETALGGALAANSGLTGDAADKQVDFRHLEQQLRDYVASAKQRFDRAVSVMTDLQAIKNGTKTPDILTTQEKADIAVSAGRTAAEASAEPIDTDRSALYTARDDLDSQIVKQIGIDVDAVAGDATIKGKRDAVTAAASKVQTDSAGVVASGDKATLDQWEAVMQDAAWRTLIDYMDATATLNDLKTTDIGKVVTDLTTAEDTYATALGKATKAQREAAALTDVIALRAKRATASDTALSSRLLSAVRGDSF